MVQLLSPGENASHHRALVQRYRQLCDLDAGMSPQQRGTELNQLLAAIFRGYGIPTRVGRQTERGEIDVSFKLGDTRFILEAKWYANKIDYGPLSLLDSRTRQRLEGTLGIFVSMSGYTKPAVEQVSSSGDRLRIVLFDAEHVEALIAGLASPDELIGAALGEAAAAGRFYCPVSTLLYSHDRSSQPPIQFGPLPDYTQELVEKCHAEVTARIALHSSEEIRGVAIRDEANLLVSIRSGLVNVDLEKRQARWILGLSSIARNPFTSRDGRIYILRGAAVARLDDSRLHLVGGGFGSGSTIFQGPHGEPWVLDHRGEREYADSRAVELVELGERLGTEQHYDLEGDPVNEIRNAGFIGERRFVLLDSDALVYVDLNDPSTYVRLRIDISNPYGLAVMESGAVMVVGDKSGVTVMAAFPDSETTADLVDLNLSGSVSEAAGAGTRLYVLSHAPVNERPVPVVVEIGTPSGISSNAFDQKPKTSLRENAATGGTARAMFDSSFDHYRGVSAGSGSAHIPHTSRGPSGAVPQGDRPQLFATDIRYSGQPSIVDGLRPRHARSSRTAKTIWRATLILLIMFFALMTLGAVTATFTGGFPTLAGAIIGNVLFESLLVASIARLVFEVKQSRAQGEQQGRGRP